MWPDHGMHIISNTKEVIAKDICGMIRDKKTLIFVCGSIDYESIHGKKYRTVFCSTYNPEAKVFQTYKLYNSFIELN